jgi:hypothetical protein
MSVVATSTPKPSGLPNPYDITAGHSGQYPNMDQARRYPPVDPQSTQRIAQMTRLRLRDLPRPFLVRQTCSGVAWRFQLPIMNIQRDTLQVVITDTTAGTLDVGYPPPPGPPPLNNAGQPIQYGYPQPLRIPEVEEYPISILVTIMALWDMAVGAAQQHDVHTPDGVTIPIGQTFNQITSMIGQLQQQYLTLSSALGVGLYRITMSKLRRTSRTTKRLVPVYRSKEYDDITWPQRELPQIDVVEPMYTYQGLWTPDRPYAVNDLIDWENNRYVAVQPSTNIEPTNDVDPTTGLGYYWQQSTINTGWVGWW